MFSSLEKEFYVFYVRVNENMSYSKPT